MTRRDGWLWCVLLTIALLLHAAIPACFQRYEYLTLGPENADVLKIDRWTGAHQHRFIVGPRGRLFEPGADSIGGAKRWSRSGRCARPI